jgi:3-(3-hydroxy-phenyl)propionate hydroxylase
MSRFLDFDAVISGYGPVGATLASLLGARGWRVAVLEKTSSVYDKPRAITLDHEVMRILQAAGVADKLAPTTSVHPGTDFLGVDGQFIKHFLPQGKPYPLGWDPNIMFLQPELEVMLRAKVSSYQSVRVLLSHELVDLTQSPSHVEATALDLTSRDRLLLRARYAIACDGASSFVRKTHMPSIDDLEFDEWWLVVDATVQNISDLPERCVQYCRPSRPGTYIVGPGNLRRWEIKILPHEQPRQFEARERYLHALSDFVDIRTIDVIRVAVYRFHALVAHDWRRGRIFLAGDAAHQMPPFLGQGLSGGIRDAANLAWKLAAVDADGASPNLLDTYMLERKAHVRKIVEHAKEFGEIIGEIDETKARHRDKILTESLSRGVAETIRQRFIPGLVGGLLGRDHDGRVQEIAGSLFVQPWILTTTGGRRRLDDLVSSGFLMVARKRDFVHWLKSPEARMWYRIGGQDIAIARARGLTPPAHPDADFYECESTFDEWLLENQAEVVIVRPDKYVFGIACAAGELNALIRQLYQSLFEDTLHPA